MDLKPAGWYARALRATLPEQIHVPATSRVLWLPVHAAIIATLVYQTANRPELLPRKPLPAPAVKLPAVAAAAK